MVSGSGVLFVTAEPDSVTVSLVNGHMPNQDEEAGSFLGASSCFTVVVDMLAGGVLGLVGSAPSLLAGCVSAGLSVGLSAGAMAVKAGCESMSGVLDSHPSHPEDVAGRWAVADGSWFCEVAAMSVSGLWVWVTFPPWLLSSWFSLLFLSSFSFLSTAESLLPSTGRPSTACSGIFGRGGIAAGELLKLAASPPLLRSNLLRSGGRLDRTVPPLIFSRATDVDGDALDDCVQGPYQLRALRMVFCFIVSAIEFSALETPREVDVRWSDEADSATEGPNDVARSGCDVVPEGPKRPVAEGFGRCLLRLAIMHTLTSGMSRRAAACQT